MFLNKCLILKKYTKNNYFHATSKGQNSGHQQNTGHKLKTNLGDKKEPQHKADRKYGRTSLLEPTEQLLTDTIRYYFKMLMYKGDIVKKIAVIMSDRQLYLFKQD